MTLIVGIELPGKSVVMGADSFVGADGDNCGARIRKVERRGSVVIGSSGTIGCQDFFMNLLEIPVYKGGSPLRWVREEFGEAVRECLRANGLSALDVDGDTLIGVGGRLVAFQGRVGAHEFGDDFAAIGSGSTWAQGSLEATAKLRPRTRIRKALEAAAKYSGSIRPPWVYAQTG